MQSAGEPGVTSVSAEIPAFASAESGRNRRNEFVLIILPTACSNCPLYNGIFDRPDFDSTLKSELWKSSHRLVRVIRDRFCRHQPRFKHRQLMAVVRTCTAPSA